MPLVRSEAVCVRHWDFSETSQTVSLFARDLGMVRGLAKGAKREHGRFSGGIDLLTRGQMVAIVKQGRELATLTDWDLLETFRHLRERLDANRAGFYMAELCSRMIADDHPHPRTYDALVDGLRGLRGPGAVDLALLRFQWVLLDDCGYRPSLQAPASGDRLAFSPGAGGVIGQNDGEPSWPVRAETIEEIRRVAEWADRAAGREQPEESRDEAQAVGPGPAEEDDTSADPTSPRPTEATRRAARLLAAYLRELMGFEPPTMLDLFGPIEVARRNPGRR